MTKGLLAYTCSLFMSIKIRTIANTIFKIISYHTDNGGFLGMALQPQRER